MAKSKHYYIRRTHRYMGVFLGIQFLFWTIGGLYFSWTDIDEIHGDFQHKATPPISADISLVSPSVVFRHLVQKPEHIKTIQVINILEKPFYSIHYTRSSKEVRILADAQTGIIREPVKEDEAVKIAAMSFNGIPKVKSVEYLTTTNGHHEYREKPLPAWAIKFDHPSGTTVYVSSEFGKVESFRNDKWRVFDFLWMMHTMDYKQRDNMNNWLLRTFSIVGLLTIVSGFVLFWSSSKRKKRNIATAQTVSD
jgi:hypothetical protein